MTEFFTSDLHIGHTNILRYDNRPFQSITHHDQHIVANWCEQVREEDTVYLLGDFGMSHQQYLISIRRQLTGHIHLIRGNHDRKIQSQLRDSFESIKDYNEIVIQDEDAPGKHRSIVLCHYPLEAWRASYYGVWHLHGHTHGDTLTRRKGRLNVGIHLHNYRLLSYKDIKQLIIAQEHAHENTK